MIRRLFIFLLAMACPVLAMAISAPANVEAWQSGPNEITLTWLPGDDNTHFCVFLDSRAINYNVTANSFVIRGVEGGWHTVGVCAIADDGYVSDMVSASVYCQSASTYTIPLAQAHWSFENDPDYLRYSVELTNTPLADYAYSGTSALLLESSAGQLAYVALPMISDVPDYDSLQLSFVARGGYWSTGAEIWAKSSSDHHLIVGAMKELPYTGFHPDSLLLLLDTVLPYATPFTMENFMADTASFWRTFTIPLDSATPPYLVFCGTSRQSNYLILDDIRITRLLPSDPSDPSNPDVDSSIDYVPVSAPHKVLRDGSVFILRDGVEYSILGTALQH